jgi:hypothetical protein
MLLGLLFYVNLAHVVVYGWPLGFPLPPQPARYFPFFGAISLAVYGVVSIAITLWARLMLRKRE